MQPGHLSLIPPNPHKGGLERTESTKLSSDLCCGICPLHACTHTRAHTHKYTPIINRKVLLWFFLYITFYFSLQPQKAAQATVRCCFSQCRHLGVTPTPAPQPTASLEPKEAIK